MNLEVGHFFVNKLEELAAFWGGFYLQPLCESGFFLTGARP